ncbi:hypothetical protein V6N13_001789 [Hibiscus sabdariffa]
MPEGPKEEKVLVEEIDKAEEEREKEKKEKVDVTFALASHDGGATEEGPELELIVVRLKEVANEVEGKLFNPLAMVVYSIPLRIIHPTLEATDDVVMEPEIQEQFDEASKLKEKKHKRSKDKQHKKKEKKRRKKKHDTASSTKKN